MLHLSSLFVAIAPLLLAHARYPDMICGMAKCPYNPENILQLQACGTAGRLGGTDIQNLFVCQDITGEDKCSITTPTPDNLGCIWVKTPKKYVEVVGAGACLPKKLGPPSIAQIGLMMFLEEASEFGVPVPSPAEQNDCLKHSYNNTNCEAASDRKGRRCGWCTGLNEEYFPFNPPTESLCVQKYALDVGACEALKVKLEPCKTKNPAATATTTLTPAPVLMGGLAA